MVVTSDNTGLLTVVPTMMSILQGQTTGQFTLNGVAFGNTIVRANATGFPEATLNVSVVLNLISSSTTLNVPFGQTAALPISIGPSPAPAGGLVLDIVSSNPSIVSVVTAQVTVPAGALSVNATVEGVAPGTATITVSNPGYASSATTVSSQANLNILETTVSFSNGVPAQPITVRLESGGDPIAALNDVVVNLSPANSQCVTVPTSVTVPAGQVTTTFQPTYGGSATVPCTTTVSASAINFVGDSVSVTVNPSPAISVTPTDTVGVGLQSANNATLGSSQHNGVTVTIASSDPSRVLVSPDATTAGTASFTRNLPNGQISIPYYVQGVQTTTTPLPTVTVSAPGFGSGQQEVTVVTPGVQIQSLITTTTTLSTSETAGTPKSGSPTARARPSVVCKTCARAAPPSS